MLSRPVWLARLEGAWRKAPIAWLAGVRRTGKTTLASQLEGARYVNCDLPSSQDLLRDPEAFYASISERRLVLDEVHQLDDPSAALKIAADAFPRLKILATGSSTLAATSKFRDSLTGRKRVVHLVPVLYEELDAFGRDVRKRLLHGGLPPMLLADQLDPEAYSEWMDSFYARDVQELFRVEKRTAFLKLLELLLRQSGGLFEVTSLARDAGLSRPTVMTYLDVLQTTQAITVLRPHHGGAAREILAQPKVYGFDTGFVCHARRWDSLRDDDCGLLWEHLVLETLQSIEGIGEIRFWRDKSQREVDFVLPRARSPSPYSATRTVLIPRAPSRGFRARDACDAIECKWSSASFRPESLEAFRAAYPKGRNFVVSPRRAPPLTRREGRLEVTHIGLDRLRATLRGQGARAD